MPTYEFRCPKGHEFERFYKTISTAPAEASCPECGAVASRQLSSGAGLLFKGSGFYLTDYGKNAHRKPTADKAEGAKIDTGKAEGGKAEGGKAETGKAEGGKTQAPSSKPETPRSDSAKPKAPGSKPKSS